MPEPFHAALFNGTDYARLHAVQFPAPPLRCVRRRPGAATAGLFQAHAVAPGRFRSPARAPWGGFDLVPDATDAEIEALITTAEAAMIQDGGQVVDLIQPAFAHAPALAPRVLLALSRRGYIVVRQELNQSLAVDGRPFLHRGAYATRKRAAKARRLGVAAGMLAPGALAEAYAVIAENRRKKGRQLSMRWEEVAAMARAFPHCVHVAGAEQEGRLIAAAIAITATPDILYVYAWGEAGGAEAASPVTLLAETLYGFAQEAGFGLLDLGTSSEFGVLNPGLHAFKASLGADSSLKLWFRKTLGHGCPVHGKQAIPTHYGHGKA